MLQIILKNKISTELKKSEVFAVMGNCWYRRAVCHCIRGNNGTRTGSEDHSTKDLLEILLQSLKVLILEESQLDATMKQTLSGEY